ncbi:MAG: thioredoxin family protein, partial [Bacteroidia bacterium]
MKDILSQGMTYAEYRNLADKLIRQGKTTGNNQNEQLVEFTKMNIQRMNRLDKTIHLPVETIHQLQAIDKPLIWLVVAEAWCGDSAQIIPVINKIANASGGKIELKTILRDVNPEVVKDYNAKSIPRLLFINKESMDVVSSWGPRPQPAQNIMKKWKESNGGISWEEFEKELHLWYSK